MNIFSIGSTRSFFCRGYRCGVPKFKCFMIHARSSQTFVLFESIELWPSTNNYQWLPFVIN